MGRQSRSQRKQLREKRDRAESRGLAVGAVPALKKRPKLIAAGVGPSHASSAAAPTGDDGLAPATLSTNRGWSSWPISIRLLLVGILVLVAIGLYRRYTEGSTTEPAPLGSAQNPH